MREKTFTFGSHGGLVGVLCEPDGGPLAGSPATLLFNIGLNHRVGPGRLNVELARRLARARYLSLRFDVSGLGDSEAREDAHSDTERQVLDLREAMDFLASKSGFRSFVLMGLCSGTDGVYGAALADPRVSGAIFVDGYAYETRGYRLRRTAEKASWLLDSFRLRRYLRRSLRRLRGRRPDDDVETGAPEPIFDRSYPPLEEFRAAVESLSGRGMKALFLYTVDAPLYNHRGQFARMAGWRVCPPGIEGEYWPDADHAFSTLAVRRRVVEHLAAWIEARFPAGDARAATGTAP